MEIWQADFYRRPLQDTTGQPLWELLVCDLNRTVEFSAFCPQSAVNADWVVQQFESWQQPLPDIIQVFRPQALGLIETAAQSLGIVVEATRRTPALKQWLQERATEYAKLPNYTQERYQPLELEKPPPMPLPETLWGEQWRFAAISAGDLISAFTDRPIPVLEMPDFVLPLNLGLASTTPVPGVIIDGGRQSLKLAWWLQKVRPVALNYVAGEPHGLILEAGLVDHWVVATFDDPEVQEAANTYQKRQQTSQGLHFLLVQPDNSGMTYSGFWLLKGE